MTEQELLPCPFCGHKNPSIMHAYDLEYMRCFNCKGDFGWDGKVDKWSDRPLEDALRERAEKAEAMVERMIEAGNRLYELAEELDDLVDEFRAYPDLVSWRALVAEWKERKDETD